LEAAELCNNGLFFPAQRLQHICLPAFRACDAALAVKAVRREHILEKVDLKVLPALRTFKMMAFRPCGHSDRLYNDNDGHDDYDVYEFRHIISSLHF